MTMSRALSGVLADRCYSYRKLEAFAAVVRQQLDMPLDEAIDPIQLFEDLHEIAIERSSGGAIALGYGVVSLEDSEGYARYDRERDILEILASEQTYQWLEEKHPRAAYFVAHELGHCVLHTDQLIRLAQMPTQQQAAFHRGRKAHRAYEDTEWQANAFASALLMPAGGMATLEREAGQLTVPMIVDRFSVSREAAGYRLELYSKRGAELLRP
jgi:Zn-dependent peptidase ImmA (M78 family)